MVIELAVAIPTLVGSICSLFAASFIFICYLVFPFKAHFRHVLILNLATADLINAANNSISGIYYVVQGSIPTGPACMVNGFIGQLSVQGTDFSILLIAVVTVIVLKAPRFLPNSSLYSQIILSLGVWMVPLATSTTALAFDAYGPVSGNWCWIKADHAELRYALTHGWRMGIIITTIGLYTYLFFFFRQVFTVDQPPSTIPVKENDTYHIMTAMANPHQFTDSTHLPHPSLEQTQATLTIMGPFELPGEALRTSWEKERDTKPCQANHQALSELTGEFPVNELEGDLPTNEPATDSPPSYTAVYEMESRDILAAAWVTNFSSYVGRQRVSNGYSIESADFDPKTDIGDIVSTQPKHATSFATTNTARNKKIQRALLLNAYPIAYILLWLPGLVNRLVELSTGKSSFVLQVLQSSTQFVGVANAITYGFNERMRCRIGESFSRQGRH